MASSNRGFDEISKKKPNSEADLSAGDLAASDSPVAEPSPWHKELADIQAQQTSPEKEDLPPFSYGLTYLGEHPTLERQRQSDFVSSRSENEWPQWHGGPSILPEPKYKPGVDFRSHAFIDQLRQSMEEEISDEDMQAIRQQMSADLELQKKDLPEVLDCIKRQGSEPVAAILDAAGKNNVLFLGEMHNFRGDQNPMREVGIEAFKRLPPGTHLAIEIPASLKSVFDDYNKSAPNTKFEISNYVDKLSNDVIEKAYATCAEYANFWQEAHRQGIQLIPIDSDVALEKLEPSKIRERMNQRDQDMKNNIKNLLLKDPDHLVVAWLGDLHGTDYKGQGESKSMVELLKEDKDLKDIRVVSFASQLGNSNGVILSLFAATQGIEKPLSVPTTENGKSNVIGNKELMTNEVFKPTFGLYTGGGSATYSGFDNVVVFPRKQDDEAAIDEFMDGFSRLGK